MPSIVRTVDTLVSQGLDRRDAQLLVLHAVGRPVHDRAWLLSHDNDTLPAEALATLQMLVPRRLKGEPMAYLTGHQAFYGLDLQVDARVLVPRPDTETLVDWALDVLAPEPEARVVDLGTGSGAIALALKHSRPTLQVQAVDFSEDALTVAQGNAKRIGLDVSFSQGSWLTGLVGKFHAIVSNPPYIREGDEHLPALIHEPLQALTAGTDGLDDIRTIINQARAYLLPNGWLLLEHGYDQAEWVRNLLINAGFTKVQSRHDLAGIERCTGGQFADIATA
jgi:release factor glutamine methyltransferase